MNVSIFGGSGFMGYDFIRHLADVDSSARPTVFSSNAGNLTNLSRHDIDTRLVLYGQLDELQLPEKTEFLINFAHPFSLRENFTPKQQISRLLKFFQRQLETRPKLRFIHISSMSVYEPFAQQLAQFDERCTIQPPSSDPYAKNKADMDREILSWKSMTERILLLRPTVVYGPFGGVWTDNIFKQFIAGPVHHYGLKGRIQPIWVSDISSLLVGILDDFRGGVYNVAGSETVTWKAFISNFGDVVEGSELKQIASTQVHSQIEAVPIHKKARNLVRRSITHPFIKEVGTPFLRPLPESIKEPLKRRLFPQNYTTGFKKSELIPGIYCRQFFEEDRLVSTHKLNQDFPGFSPTTLHGSKPKLKQYFAYRFTNELFW